MDYGIVHAGQVFTPNGRADLAPAEVDGYNRALEAEELKAWQGRPDRAIGYYDTPAQIQGGPWRTTFQVNTAGATITTWRGTRIGKVTEAKVYRDNFGGRLVYLRVIGTNGAEYWGRASWDGGNVVKLHKVRGGQRG